MSESRRVKDGEESPVSGDAQVVQHHKETHAALSEQKLLGLFASSIDGICVLREQLVVFVNPRLCEMMESEDSDLVGRAFTDFLAPEQTERTLNLYRRMRRSEIYPQRYETVLVSKGGRRIEAGINADQVDLGGQRSVVVMVRDISAQRQARQIAVENERLEAVMTVVRGVGNNFANSLSIIRNFAASILDSFLPNTRPHASAQQILNAAEHAAALTKRLLGIVRMSGAESNVHVEPVSVTTSLQKAMELVAPGLKERSIRFDIQNDKSPWFAMADAGQLLDAIMNILLNGADAMPQGGTIKVALQERMVAEDEATESMPAGAYVALDVVDTGIGMTPEQVAKLFEPFYTTKSQKHAFGLGLPVAQHMVKGWGGWIEIESEAGAGTTVRLLLPKADPNQPSVGSDLFSDLVGRTILVVEDDATRRKRIVRVLCDDHHTVLEADNAEDALRLYKAHASEIDLTVLDWIIPGGNEGQVLKNIQEYDPDGHILLISGFSKDYVRSQLRMGAWAFLQKPFSDEELRQSVNRTLPAPRCRLPQHDEEG